MKNIPFFLIACTMWLGFNIVPNQINSLYAVSTPPVVFHIDLTSGPNSGNSDTTYATGGAYVTIYGNYFGTTRGVSTVTIGGGAVAGYPSWSNNKIVVILGSSSATGAVVVTVGGVTSNSTVTFTVRSGSIYYIATTGADANPGTFSLPWQNIYKCTSTIAAGDTCYPRNGVSKTTTQTTSGFSAAVNVTSSGTAARPKALVAYPGATVIIGSSTTTYGIQNYTAPTVSYWTFAGLNVTANTIALLIRPSVGLRFVGNSFTCPTCNAGGGGAVIESAHTSNLKLIGNTVSNGSWPTRNVVSASNSNPITVVFDGVHGMTTGGRISLGGIGGNLAANGLFYVTVIDPVTVQLFTNSTRTTAAVGNGAYTSGGVAQFTSKLVHSVYLSTNSNHVEVAGNTITGAGVSACRGVQSHSSPITMGNVINATNTSPIVLTLSSAVGIYPGERVDVTLVEGTTAANGDWYASVVASNSIALYQDEALTIPVNGTASGVWTAHGVVKTGLDLFDLSIHDNVINGSMCDGINIQTVDPSLGAVSVYNNVLIDTATGPDPVEGPANYAGIYAAGGRDNIGPAGSGVINVYNNTLYKSSSRNVMYGVTLSGSGAFFRGAGQSGLDVRYRNNLVYQPATGAAQPYFAAASTTGNGYVSGSNNLWFGNGSAPSMGAGYTTGADQTGDPLFVDAANGNVAISLTGAATGAGTATLTSTYDIAGILRPNPPSIGAYEVPGAGAPVDLLVITTASLPSIGWRASGYSQAMAATGGTTPYTWSAAGLPAGMSMSSGGTISGTPTVTDTYSVIVTVTDSLSLQSSQTFVLTVTQPEQSITKLGLGVVK